VNVKAQGLRGAAAQWRSACPLYGGRGLQPRPITRQGGPAKGRALRTRIAVSAVLMIATCVACRAPAAIERRVIVLAFDGLDYEVTRALMAQGRLPNFSRLARAGSFSPLATTMPPQSPVAWSTFTTGLDPERHGIFDFVHRDAATLQPYLSTTRTEPPSWVVPLGPWRLPLRGGAVVPLRVGVPFWAPLEEHGVPTTIVRMPANYPPSGKATRELSGMGTPDLLGTYGTFSFYTSAPPPDAFAPTRRSVEGGVIHRIDVVDDVVSAVLEGPSNPFRRDGATLTTAFTLYRDAQTGTARLVIGDEQRVLKAGEWSDWIPVSFAMTPLQSLYGMCRVYVKRVQPEVELYVSPINLDPLRPALTVATPSDFAGELAASGRYYTQGMPEDTKAYVAGVLSADELLQQAATTAEENRRQYARLREAHREGLLFHYFGHVDQVSHVMWRSRDPEHPAYDKAHDAPYRTVIDDLYVGLDAIVGETLDGLSPETLLVVMSDHGFASWRRAFNLNTWLERNGYLVLNDPSRRGEPMFAGVDWSRTRAYGLGLNALYINVKGRERFGIVEPHDRAAVAAEIAAALGREIDPVTKQPAVAAVHVASSASPSGAHPDREPDVIVGYARGTRASNASALGAVPMDMLENNTSLWSGDHCMDPRSVPGVLLTSRPLRKPASSLRELADAIVEETGIRRTGSS
jgi:predicted AlkP superfamily phosphohydrolase/phosphomutase